MGLDNPVPSFESGFVRVLSTTNLVSEVIRFRTLDSESVVPSLRVLARSNPLRLYYVCVSKPYYLYFLNPFPHTTLTFLKWLRRISESTLTHPSSYPLSHLQLVSCLVPTETTHPVLTSTSKVGLSGMLDHLVRRFVLSSPTFFSINTEPSLRRPLLRRNLLLSTFNQDSNTLPLTEVPFMDSLPYRYG